MSKSLSDTAVWREKFEQNIFHLGDSDPQLKEIFSTVSDISTVKEFIHDQFIESAAAYAKRYSAVDYFQSLLIESFKRIGWNSELAEKMNILDIGSGAGNSILPLLSLCPNSEIIASDLSIPLLKILKNALIEKKLDENCKIVQMNAEQLNFVPNSFDLVVGAAILHHLFSPEKVIEGCSKILKPNGIAVFYEPFEYGSALLKIIYRSLLEDPRSILIKPGIRRFLIEMWKGLDLLMGRDKSAPIFKKLDDKWLFTRPYFEELAEKNGFSKVTIYPIHGTDNMLEQQVVTHLRLGRGVSPKALPQWAWKKIRQFDVAFSEDLKKEILLEGCIIFTK